MADHPAASRTFTATIIGDGEGSTMTAIGVPFDPRDVFGKARAPVVVRLNGHTFRSTIAVMGKDAAGKPCVFVPLRKSNREPAGVRAGDRVKVTLTLDTAVRTVEVPGDLKRALKSAGVLDVFEAMSYTHRREYVEAVEGAKKPQTRERRIEGCVGRMHERAAAAASTKNKRASKKKAKAK